MKILFIGDMLVTLGEKIIARQLPRIVEEHEIDVVLGNGENAAGGFALPLTLLKNCLIMVLMLLQLGIMYGTKRKFCNIFRVNRSFSDQPTILILFPGRGSVVIETTKYGPLGVLQLMGRVSMPLLDCPFQVADRIIESLRRSVRVIMVDMHAEATSERWPWDGI